VRYSGVGLSAKPLIGPYVPLTASFALNTLSKTRGHAYELHKSQCTRDIRSNFFSVIEPVIRGTLCLYPLTSQVLLKMCGFVSPFDGTVILLCVAWVFTF